MVPGRRPCPEQGRGRTEVGTRRGGSHLAPAGLVLGGGWAVASGCQGGAVRLQGCGEPSLGRSCWPGCGATLVCATRVPVGVCPVSFRIPAALVALDSHMCFELWLQFQGKKQWGTCPHLPPSLGRRRLCLRSMAHSSSVAQEASRGRGLSGRLRNDREVVSKDGLAARPLPADKEQDLPSQARRTDTGPRGLAGGLDAGDAVGVWGQRGERTQGRMWVSGDSVEKGRWLSHHSMSFSPG